MKQVCCRGTRGCMRTWRLCGAECETRQGVAARPAGKCRSTCRTRSRRPSPPRFREPLFTHLHHLTFPALPSLRPLVLSFNLAVFISPQALLLSLTSTQPSPLSIIPPLPFSPSKPTFLPSPPSPLCPPLTTLRDSAFPDVRRLLHH